MAFLFNNDKSKLPMGEAMIKKSYTKQATISAGAGATAIIDLSSDELYSKDYTAAGVVGWGLNDSEVKVTGAYMESLSRARVNLYNPKTYSSTVGVSIDVLWVKG